MPRALWTGASGMAAQQTNVDVIANNIANVNTAGFKKQRASFQDLFYDIRSAPGGRIGDNGLNPTGVQIGHGVRLTSTERSFTEGNLQVTNVQTDMAIEGDGFFKVTLADGNNAYTRAGNFRRDADGNLVTPDGNFLEPRITIPSDATDIIISRTGVVSVTQGVTQSQIGSLTLTRFPNPGGLVAKGGNLFFQSPASGAPQDGNPGDIAFGEIQQGAIENANVEVVTELVNLITAQRAYELNSKSITTADQMLQTANEIARS